MTRQNLFCLFPYRTLQAWSFSACPVYIFPVHTPLYILIQAVVSRKQPDSCCPAPSVWKKHFAAWPAFQTEFFHQKKLHPGCAESLTTILEFQIRPVFFAPTLAGVLSCANKNTSQATDYADISIPFQIRLKYSKRLPLFMGVAIKLKIVYIIKNSIS